MLTNEQTAQQLEELDDNLFEATDDIVKEAHAEIINYECGNIDEHVLHAKLMTMLIKEIVALHTDIGRLEVIIQNHQT